MFDQTAWYVLAFDIDIGEHNYTKDKFNNDYMINGVSWEYDPDDTSIPSLLIAVVELKARLTA